MHIGDTILHRLTKVTSSITFPEKDLDSSMGRVVNLSQTYPQDDSSDFEWEKKLPPDYEWAVANACGGPIQYQSSKELYDRFCSHLLVGEGLEGYGCDPNTGCMYRTFAARTLKHIEESSHERYWQWIPGHNVPGSRFQEVALLLPIRHLKLWGEITTRLPAGSYSLCWVLQFAEKIEGVSTNVGLGDWKYAYVDFTFSDGGDVESSKVEFNPSVTNPGRFRMRGDGRDRVQFGDNNWFEYRAGTFTVEVYPGPQNTTEVNLSFSVMEATQGFLKSGLVVDGVIIRQQFSGTNPTEASSPFSLPEEALPIVLANVSPRDVKRVAAVARSFAEAAARSELVFKRMLPYNYEWVAANAQGGPIWYHSIRELYDALCSHIRVGEGLKGYGCDPKTGGMYQTFAARTLSITWGSEESYWAWIPGSTVPGARFEEVALMRRVCWLEIRGNIKTRLLPGTYTFSWVLKFAKNIKGIQGQDIGFGNWKNAVVEYTFSDGGDVQSSKIEFDPQSLGRLRTEGGDWDRVDWKNLSHDSRDNDWFEYIAGNFTVEPKDCGDSLDSHEVDLSYRMIEITQSQWKGGLVVDGVVIRQQTQMSHPMWIDSTAV